MPYHIRDDEARIALLSPCPLVPFDQRGATLVELPMYPVALWIPNLEAAAAMDVPDESWRGWLWSTDEFVLVHLDRDPTLPRLGALTAQRPAFCRLDIAGRPMRVWRVAPGDAAWAANAYAAEVHGYLDEKTHFWGQAVAASEGRRELLLACLATLHRVPPLARFDSPARG